MATLWEPEILTQTPREEHHMVKHSFWRVAGMSAPPPLWAEVCVERLREKEEGAFVQEYKSILWWGEKVCTSLPSPPWNANKSLWLFGGLRSEGSVLRVSVQPYFNPRDSALCSGTLQCPWNAFNQQLSCPNYQWCTWLSFQNQAVKVTFWGFSVTQCFPSLFR